ncbi:expressed unknown protein [Seminavis robusta]|uniref:Uncharacterized protein n=1 Tax=Seminavis robusta TaxID=568900 RepID=A0A9N8HT48_9STRA|nr:expressed unknown protein [Seminavis robusta]|eukprot:Sro1234_g254900.1 n/a (163) ;mRNA; r:14612-15100
MLRSAFQPVQRVPATEALELLVKSSASVAASDDPLELVQKGLVRCSLSDGSDLALLKISSSRCCPSLEDDEAPPSKAGSNFPEISWVLDDDLLPNDDDDDDSATSPVTLHVYATASWKDNRRTSYDAKTGGLVRSKGMVSALHMLRFDRPEPPVQRRRCTMN